MFTRLLKIEVCLWESKCIERYIRNAFKRKN